MEKRILDKVEESFLIAEKFFGRSLTRCKVTFTTCSPLGYYNPNDHSLNFNPLYFSQNIEEFLRVVVPHEVAHATDKLVYGIRYSGSKQIHHGKSWSYIMTAVYKLPADRCCKLGDDYEKPIQRIRNHFTYKCNCRTHSVSSVVHNRIGKGMAYRCSKCGCMLSFQGENTQRKVNLLLKKLNQVSNGIGI